MWIYEEEQKCLDEMAKYPIEAIEAKLERRKNNKVEVVLDTLFTFSEFDEV